MKNLKVDLRLVFIFIVSLIVSGTTGAIAANMINASTVAYNSENVSTVQDALDTLYDSIDVVTILPTGSIIPYMGTTAPENYLICNGAVYNIEDYQKLADHIKDNFGSYNKFGGNGTTTFAVPDLRGEFLRGAGTNSHTNQGNGAAVGTHQNATQHVGIYGWGSNQVSVSASNSTSSEARAIEANVDSSTSRVGRFNISSNFVNNNDSMNSLYTSRPTNTSVNYLIKAK